MGIRFAAIGGLATLFAVLAALYVDGRFDRLDSYALEHWMPGLSAEPGQEVWPPIYGLFLPFTLDASTWEVAISLLTYPASALVSFLAFAGCCIVLWRRGERFPALVWALSWFAANAIGVTLKASLARPLLYHEDDAGVVHHLVGYNQSFPSGHTIRAVMVAGILVYVWRRALAPAVVWALAVSVTLVIVAAHVPADVVGGLVFGLLVVVVVTTVADSRRLEAWSAERWALLRRAPSGPNGRAD
jgi:membrane-associated phospholipid phosphatase